MAVVKQKLATVSGKMENLEAAVLYCASADSFFPEEPPRSVSSFKRYVSPGDANPYTSLKGKAKALLADLDKSLLPSEKKKAACNVPVYSDSTQYAQYLGKMEAQLGDLENKCEKLKKRLNENRIIIEQLGHLKTLDYPLRDLYSFKYIKIRFGYLPRENFDRFEVYIGSIKSAIFLPSSIEKDSVWGMYLTLRDSSTENDSVFATLGFKRVRLPDKADGIPVESIHELQVETAQIQKKYNKAKKELHDFALGIYSELHECEDYLSMLARAFEVKKKVLLVSEDNFTFYGWVNSHTFSELKKTLKKADSEITEESFEREDINDPPVILKNPKIFKPFQEFVEMYGLPAYNELDPTPFVAITYSFFFGMMFGDVGQGLILLIGGLLAKKLYNLKLGGAIAVTGFLSIAFGFIYGSFFGDEELIHGLIKPMENVNTILITAVGIGVLMITICSLLNIFNGIRQKRMDKYLLSPNGIVGLSFYWSILLLLFNSLGVGNIGIPRTVIVAVLLISMIMLFAREPLAKLFSGKKNWLPENIVEAIVENFFELFEIVLSYVTNTISFIRIGAFALSHASMMAVVFMLANQQGFVGKILIIILGNLLVTALEGLIVGIQVLRLEFYELFSRFYEGTGNGVKEQRT